jgi:hypothetical protein
MNNLTKIVMLLSALAVGGVSDHLYFKSVSIERTKSGLFVLDAGHIYEMVELDFSKDVKVNDYTSVPSYGDSSSYRLPTGKK